MDWSVMMVLRSVTQMQEVARGSVVNAEGMMQYVVGVVSADDATRSCLYVSLLLVQPMCLWSAASPELASPPQDSQCSFW